MKKIKQNQAINQDWQSTISESLDQEIESALAAGEYRLTDLVSLDVLTEILDAFTAATGFGSTIIEVDGTPITHYSNFCPLCRMTRETPLGAQKCYQSGSILGRKSVEQGQVVYQRCMSAGLVDAAAPIVVRGHHIANWIAGQVLVDDLDEAHFRRFAREIGADEEAFIDAFHQVTRVSEEQVQKSAQLLCVIAKHIAEMGLRRLVDLKLQERLESALEQVQSARAEQERLQQEVIEAQRQAIQELSTPVIPVIDAPGGGGSVIVMPLIGAIDTIRARDITRRLLAGIAQHRAKIVILDVTGVPMVDSGVANHLNKTIHAARLKGARTILTGISNAVAETVVDLGIDWRDVETLSDLQTGLMTALDHLGLGLARKPERKQKSG